MQEDRESTKLDDLIKTNPLLLDSKDPEVIKVSDYYLPYSTGFEIECEVKAGVTKRDFDYIPNLLDLDINGYEQRFRIKTGIEGLKSLRLISDAMIKYGLFNPGSGIHYHVDCTDVYDSFTVENVDENAHWMYEELETWGYTGEYNKKIIHLHNGRWIRFQSGFKTMEFRIGNMAFDYPTLFERIRHANDIVRRFKSAIYVHPLERYGDDYEQTIKNRLIQI